LYLRWTLVLSNISTLNPSNPNNPINPSNSNNPMNSSNPSNPSNPITPVTFLNRKGLKLFGMLHTPAGARKDVGIIILSPGIKSRVAPHRLYVKMAKRFCEMGFCVLRFDPEGIGDSEGEIDERMVAEFYASVQVGRFVNDTVDAIDWMEKEFGAKHIILAGLCGGAITALHAGAQDKRVDQIIGLGMPVSLNGSNVDPYRYISRGQLGELRKGYLGKMISGKAWLRFLSFRSDYRLILRSLTSFLKDAVYSLRKGNNGSPQVKANISNSNLNPLFPVALKKLAMTRKISLIFSGADRLHWEFEEKYMQNYSSEFQELGNNIDVHIIKNANHILSFTDWQDEMLEKISLNLKDFNTCSSHNTFSLRETR